MRSSMKRRAVLGVLGATLGIVAPVASASAATAPVAPAKLAAFGFPGFVPGAWGGPVLNGQAGWGSIVGPAVITTAPSSFINTNNQVSAGGNWSGGQVVAP
jgi:hypothetical protein